MANFSNYKFSQKSNTIPTRPEINSSCNKSNISFGSIDEYDYITRNTTRDDLGLSCSLNDSDVQNVSNLSNSTRYEAPRDDKDMQMNARLARRFDNELLALTENQSLICAEDDPGADEMDISIPLPEIRTDYSILDVDEDDDNEVNIFC